MKKRLLSIILTAFLVLSMVPYAAFADSSIVCPACGGSVTKQERRLLTAHDDFFKCDKCGKWAWANKLGSLNLFSVGDQQILEAADSSGLLNFSFNNGHLISAEKAPTGIGRKDLPGYADDKGAALVDKDGWPTATYTMLLDGYDTSAGVDTVYKHSKFNNGSWFNQVDGSYSVKGDSVTVYSIYNDANSSHSLIGSISYYYKAPVSGYYTLNSFDISGSYSIRGSGGSYYYGSYGEYSLQFQYYFGDTVHSPTLDFKNVVSNQTPFHVTRDSLTKYFTKGQLIYFSFRVYPVYSVSKDYPYKSITIQSTAPTLTVQDLTPNQITNNNNITINNNTWNGNIYVDNSTNLTYIYPQYTTINEINETVTNISNNPIIYNNETKQYYTYNSVTNNYYYITYEQQPSTPTPSPSPSPSPAPSESPTPDPGENPTPTSTPGGGTIITPGGDNPGSTSTPESGNKGDGGSSGWNPFKWLTDLLKDLIESILKGIWKLLTSIFGFILWLLSLLFKLFPWMPNSGILALCAGVVVVTVIRIIKFITGR